jgi:hypothetical protein
VQFVVDTNKKTVAKVKDDAGVSIANVAGYTDAAKGTSTTTVSKPSVDDSGAVHFSMDNTAKNGLSDRPLAPQDQIMTTVNFVVTADGKVGLDPGGMRTAYPSIGIYSYSANGKTQTILEVKESGNLEDLKRKNQSIPAVTPK